MDSYLFYIKRLHNFAGNILLWNVFAMSVISFFEGISIFLLISVINVSGIIKMSGFNQTLSSVMDFINNLPQGFTLLISLGIFIVLVIGQNFIQKKLSVTNAIITNRFIGQLRVEAYSDLLHADWSFFTRKRKSDLVNYMTIELARVASGITMFLSFISSIIFTIIQIGLALWLSAKMTGFVLISGLFLGFFSRKYIRQSKDLGRKTSILAQEYLAGITDQLNGIKDIKSNSIEASRLTWLSNVVDGMVSEQIEYMKIKTASQVMYKISSTILISAFIFFSYIFFHSQPAQFMIIIIIFSRLWPRITGIQSNLEQLASMLPAFKLFREFQTECKQVVEVQKHQTSDVALPLCIDQDIKFRNVDFRYNKHELNYALKDINVVIPAKKMTAIVGHSGAGKSTLIDILMGLNKPETGELFIDEESLTNSKIPSLRNAISYVPQDPFLFNASIRENLLLVAPHATEEQIWNSLELAAAKEFVTKMKNGLDTLVGDRGVRLSGGERQRLVLARAILRKPAILILDEATSALDSENEAKIQEAIETLKGTMTIIVIAHRLSTIRNADQVIVLDHGRVIQQGEFSKLANEVGMFSNLLGRQLEVPV